LSLKRTVFEIFDFNDKTLRQTQTLRAGCSKAEPKIFDPPQTPFPGPAPWDEGRGWPRRNMPPMCHFAKCSRSKSNGTSVITEIRLKKLALRVPPFKVTQGYRNRHVSIGYL